MKILATWSTFTIPNQSCWVGAACRFLMEIGKEDAVDSTPWTEFSCAPSELSLDDFEDGQDLIFFYTLAKQRYRKIHDFLEVSSARPLLFV